MTQDIPKLHKFAQYRDILYFTNKTQRSAYGTPEKPQASEGITIPDGTPALDIRAAIETDKGFAWVFAGPMLDPDIPDGQASLCPTPSACMLNGLEGAFKTLATLQAAKPEAAAARGPLDMVGVAEYVEGWKKHGARVGAYAGGTIVWQP
jgi:hypothetical protein